MFRGANGASRISGGGKGLGVLANEEADALLREVEALRDAGGTGEVGLPLLTPFFCDVVRHTSV